MSEDKEIVLKQSLIVNAYQNYHTFIKFLKSVPVDQNNQLVQEAYKFIDIGMICFEKVIAQSPLSEKEVPIEAPQDTGIQL